MFFVTKRRLKRTNLADTDSLVKNKHNFYHNGEGKQILSIRLINYSSNNKCCIYASYLGLYYFSKTKHDWMVKYGP